MNHAAGGHFYDTVSCYDPCFMREGRFYKFWVYIMASCSGTLYIGLTGSLESRVRQHKEGRISGFTKKYSCHRLVYYESFDDVHRAIAREKQLKGWSREKKVALIEKMNPRWADMGEHWGREMRLPGQLLDQSR